MSALLHLKDQFGNNMYFGDTGHIRLPAVPNVDFTSLLQTVRDVTMREDDVMVVGYPKSGNNWTHHMVCMLKEGTTELMPMFTHDSFFFIDALGTSSNQQVPPADGPRVFLSHLPFRFLPRDVTKKKVKVVYVTRNPKDVFVSLYNHLQSVKPPLGYGGSWDQFFTVMLEQGYWYGEMMEYLKDWQTEIEAHSAHIPIYICNYEDSKRDTLAQVQRLNEFLDMGRDRQLCEQIVHTCRFDNMPKTRCQSEETIRKVWLCKDNISTSFLYRKGMVGDWKNWFTVAQNEQFDDVYNTKMAVYK